MTIDYTARERFWLWALAVFGFVVANGGFLYGLFLAPNALADAMANPIAVSFIVEALVLVGVFAYLLRRWGVSTLSWGWFVVLSLIGSMAFALPVVLLARRSRSARSFLIFLALAVVASSSSAAQTPRQDVVDQLKVIADAKAEDGFAPDSSPLGRPTLLGVLEHESTIHLEITLDAGREYHIAARCDSGCSDLDTRLLATDFDPLAEDTRDNDQPRMDIKPLVSGTHLLAINMASCKDGICYFGVVILSRPAGR